MMRIRTAALVVLAIFALAAICVAADAPKDCAKQPGKTGMRFAKELGLTKEQAQQIRDIVEKFHADVKDVVKTDATKADKAAKIKDLKTTVGDAIMAVLTPDQQEKAKQMNLVKRLLSPAREHAGGLDRILAQLNLNDAQRAKIKTIQEDSETKAKAIRDDTSLTPDQKRTNMQDLRQQTIVSIEGVMTDAQKAKFEELLKANPWPKGKQGKRGA